MAPPDKKSTLQAPQHGGTWNNAAWGQSNRPRLSEL